MKKRKLRKRIDYQPAPQVKPMRIAKFHMVLIGPKGPRLFKPNEPIPDGYK